MSSIKTMEELFHDELFDMYDAERQITKALPKMAEKATDKALAQGFKKHLKETEGQIARLEKCFQLLGIEAEKETCEATQGLLKEGDQLMKDVEQGPVLDAALIAAAQKVEHYEIATYGTLICWARQLGHEDVATLLEETIEEEKTCDETLTEMAEDHVNENAQMAA